MPSNFFESSHCGKPGVGARAHCKSCRTSAMFRGTLAKSFDLDANFECPWGANEEGEFPAEAPAPTPRRRGRTQKLMPTGSDWVDKRAQWLDSVENAWQRSQHPLEGSKFLEWLKARKPKNIVEIGYRTGSNSYMLAGALQPGGVVEGVDPARLFRKQRKTISRKLAEEGRTGFVQYRASSEDLLTLPLREEFYDAIYIDGDHSYVAALRDWKLATMRLQPYGCLGFHDTSNMKRHWEKRCSKFFQDAKQHLPDHLEDWHTDEHMRGMGVGAVAFNGRLLFIVNGGLGDAVELTRTMLVASKLGYLVHVRPLGAGASAMKSVWDMIPWINAVDSKTAKKYEYEAVLCSTSMKALKERASGLNYKKLVNGKPGRGSMVANNQKLLVAIGHDLKTVNKMLMPAPLQYLKPAHTPSVGGIVLAPGIGSQLSRMERGEMPDKRYHKWKETISYLPKPVHVVGTESARSPWLAQIVNKRDVFDLIGTTPLVSDLLPLMWSTTAVVCSDNGIGHLARLVGITTFSIFTTTDPRRFAPEGATVLLDKKDDPMVPGEVAHQIHLLHNPECQRPPEQITDKKISVIITTHNEGDEVVLTCKDVYANAGCPVEIIVIDEGSTDGSCENLPDYVKVVRNEQRTGVAPARNQGYKLATGEAMMFLDAHMRVRPGTPAKMMLASIEKDALIVPGVAPLYSPTRGAVWVCKWAFKGGRLRSRWHSACSDEFSPTDCFVAPGWVVTPKIWEKMGPWANSLSHWGSTEVYKSLQAAFSGVPMLAMREAVTWHRFRGRFPYKVSNSGIFKNAYAAAKIIFGDEVFHKMFLPIMQQHHWGDHIEEVLTTDEMLADCEDFAKRRVVDPEEFLKTHFPKGLETPVEDSKVSPSFFDSEDCTSRRVCQPCRLDPTVQQQIMENYDTKSKGPSFECPHGVTADDFSDMEYPPKAKIAANAIAATARAAKALATGKEVLVKEEEYDRRMDVCRGCEVYDKKRKRCRKCGCYTSKKIWIATESCPFNKW